MPNISISEKDFELVAGAAIEALRKGDSECAIGLDKIARKMNAVLSTMRLPNLYPRLSWKEVPSVLGPEYD